LTKDIICSNEYLTIGNYVRLQNQRFAHIFRILKKEGQKFLDEMDQVQKSQELGSDIVIVVHYLKIFDRGLFCFDEKGSNILLEAKKVLTN